MADKKEEKMKECFRVWNLQQQEGFVGVSKRDNNVGKNDPSYWQDQVFPWPEGRIQAQRWFDKNQATGIDLYWCPAVFKQKRRVRDINKVEYAGIHPGRILYADLDPVDPETLKYRPSLSWRSSDNRYQCLWVLDKQLPPSELEKLNKAMTYSVGADKGGWDLTQVLRIPGSTNYKYDPPQKGSVMWSEFSRIYNKDNFQFAPVLDQTSAGKTTLIELLSKYRKLIKSKVSRLLQYPPNRVEQGNRSDVLWYIESELIQAKIPMEDIASMIQQSAWNKYKGRRDEWERITTEITKVYEGSYEGKEPLVEDQEEVTALKFTNYEDLMGSSQSQPGWMVRDIWLKHSHGMIAGEPKTFKSTAVLDLAVSVASGKPLWGRYNVEDQGPVVFIQNENAEWMMKDRLEKIITSKELIGSVVKRGRVLEITFPPILPIHFLNNSGYNFSDPLHRQQLEDTLRVVKPKLVVLDPLYLMFEGEINSAKDLQPILQWLLALRNDFKTSVIVIHHWNKNGGSSRGGQRMLGSTTLHGWTDSSLYLNRSDDGTGEISKVEVEREFRAAGMMPKLELSITMGNAGDPTYNVSCNDVASGPSEEVGLELLDILSSYPEGAGIQTLAKDLSITRRQVENLIKKVEDKLIYNRNNKKYRLRQSS